MNRKRIVDVDVERSLCEFFRCPNYRKGCDAWRVTLVDSMGRIEQFCCDATPWESIACMKDREADVYKVMSRNKTTGNDQIEIVPVEKYERRKLQGELFYEEGTE